MPRREPFAGKTNKRMIRAAERASLALQLRIQGLTYPEIAQRLGYKSPNAAWYAVYRTLQKMPAANAEALRQIELERTEVAMQALYDRVREGDCNAIKRWTDLIELRCRILGLFAPTEVKHGTVDNDSDPLFRLLDALAKRVEANTVGTAALPTPRGTEGDSAE